MSQIVVPHECLTVAQEAKTTGNRHGNYLDYRVHLIGFNHNSSVGNPSSPPIRQPIAPAHLRGLPKHGIVGHM